MTDGPVFEKQGVEIFVDEYAVNPRVWGDNLGTMVCFHGKYQLGDTGHGYGTHRNFGSWGDVAKEIKRREGPLIILPLYLYDHSGITMNTTGFSHCDSAGWDWGQVGFIFASHRKIREALGTERVSPQKKDEARNMLRGEVDLYDKYLRGLVYGYVHGDDSCWGFYDCNPEELADAVINENKERINE